MSFWDSLGRLAKFLTETPGYTPSAEAGQRAPSAGYRPDSMGKTPAQTPKTAAVPVPGAITRYNVASLADISKNLPDSPGSWNDSVESLRKETVELGGRAFTGALNVLEVATGPGELKPSLEKVAPALAAGLENVRKNYAFSRDLEANSSGMGLLNIKPLKLFSIGFIAPPRAPRTKPPATRPAPISGVTPNSKTIFKTSLATFPIP